MCISTAYAALMNPARDSLAGVQIVDGFTVLAKHAKTWRVVVVLVHVPEDVNLLESLARYASPVGLGVLDTGDSSAVVSTAYRPASLGHPDPLARRDGVDSITGSGHALPESGCGVTNRTALEVRVAIHADKVAGLDDCVVGGVDPNRCVSTALYCLSLDW